MIPTPIRLILSTIERNGIRALLMGGQACVLYGAAQISKDVDLLVLAEEENLSRLKHAMAELGAREIAVPKFGPDVLARGHAVHFRCQAPGTQGVRIDVMTTLRDLPDFETLWERRTTFRDDEGTEIDLLSIPDLVNAKKTQRSKDWPVIEGLVAIHYAENAHAPTDNMISFWLCEARSPELLCQLVADYPEATSSALRQRPLLALAESADLDALREALDREVRNEQAKDRAYWAPLKKELESFRRDLRKIEPEGT